MIPRNYAVALNEALGAIQNLLECPNCGGKGFEVVCWGSEEDDWGYDACNCRVEAFEVLEKYKSHMKGARNGEN